MLRYLTEGGAFSSDAGATLTDDGEHGGDPIGWMLNPVVH